MATVNPPRGMRDFLPDQMEKRGRVLTTIRRTYARHGFDEVETPVMIDAKHLEHSDAGENDKLTYRVLRRGLTPSDISELGHRLETSNDEALPGWADDRLSDLALRYDLTFPLARFFATNRASFPGTLRSLQIGPVWRAERNQAGRFRQFVQCDIDILGASEGLPEVELLVASAAALKALRIGRFAFRVSDRRVLQVVLQYFHVEPSHQRGVMEELDKLDKREVGEVVESIGRLTRDRSAAHDLVELTRSARRHPAHLWDVVRSTSVNAARHLVEGLQEIVEGVNAATSTRVAEVDLSVVRGLGYYTGPVFEIAHPESKGSIGGGGRYDAMVDRFGGGNNQFAAGISLGFERLVELVRVTPRRSKSIVLFTDTLDIGTVMRTKAELLRSRWRVRVELRPKSLDHSLNEYRALGYTHWATLDANRPFSAAAIREMRG